MAAQTRQADREEFGKALLHSNQRLNHTASTGHVVIRRAHKTNVDSQCVCARSNALIVQREKAVHPQGHTLTPLRSEEHTSELQSRSDLVCRLLLEKKKKNSKHNRSNIDQTYNNKNTSHHTQ